MSREIKFRAWDKAFDKMINFDDTWRKLERSGKRKGTGIKRPKEKMIGWIKPQKLEGKTILR